MIDRCQADKVITGIQGCTNPARWILTLYTIKVKVCSKHLARQADRMSRSGTERRTLGLVPITEKDL